MDSLRSRPYTGLTDLQAMIHLAQVLRANGQIVYPNATDLYEELPIPRCRPLPAYGKTVIMRHWWGLSM